VIGYPYNAAVQGFDELRGLRRGLAGWMAEAGADETTVAEVVLAVGELATNGMEASARGEATVRAEATSDTVRVVVINEGEPFRGPVEDAADPFRLRGRGLTLVAAIADSLAFGEVDGCTEVTMTKRYVPTGAGSTG
jgi:anti-sigma regulatory factor (Ser/Thr protein kinase)